jgi:MFS family permease
MRTGAPTKPRFTLLILTLAFSMSFMDRQLPSVLAQSIKADLHLSDTDLGLLSGLYFSLFYTSFGLLMGWLADRVNRVRLIGTAIITWSIFTAASGMASNLWQLVPARMGVGVGEAACNPASYSMISDLYPQPRRGLPMSIFMLGIPIGTILGVGIGAWAAADLGWRWAFAIAGGLGLIVAATVFLFLKEPVRGTYDDHIVDPSQHAEGFLAAARAMYLVCRSSPLILMALLCTASGSFVSFALLVWSPALLTRDKAMSLHELAIFFGPMSGITSMLGIVIGGALMNRFSTSRKIYLLMPGTGFLLGAPCLVAAAFATGWHSALAYLIIPFLFSVVKDAPSVALMHSLVPPERRAMATALLVWINSALGLTLGPLFVGRMSDLLQPAYGTASLEWAFAGLAPFSVLAAFVYFRTARMIAEVDERTLRIQSAIAI